MLALPFSAVHEGGDSCLMVGFIIYLFINLIYFVGVLVSAGKSVSVVALVQLLTLLGKTVLLTSYTHSALDNILLKLKVIAIAVNVFFLQVFFYHFFFTRVFLSFFLQEFFFFFFYKCFFYQYCHCPTFKVSLFLYLQLSTSHSCFYASLSSGDAYKDRLPNPNFEL